MRFRRWLRTATTAARTDLLALGRSRAVGIGAVLFALVVALRIWTITPGVKGEVPGYLVLFDPGAGTPEPTAFVIFGLGRLMPVILSFVAVGYGAGAIAGSRQAGTIRTLQSLPVSRSNVVVGTMFARLSAITVVVVSGLLSGAIVAMYRFGEFSAGPYASFVLATLLFAIVLTTFTVSVSTVVSTRLRAIAFSLGPLVLVSAFGGDRGLPLPVRSSVLVQPYHLLVSASHEQLVAIPRIEHAIVSGRTGRTIDTGTLETIDLTAGAPVYLTDPGAVGSLLCWGLFVPLAIVWYRRVDL
ncbi:ABC transporter permease [Halovivax cerinus]|uniref:ABC transporter permease n=1 Tax=Halovivax cerinus TaxID=1487865 RepID=UPI0021159259|nr:ABC transporter permease subunit [Halovivax cerinus]